jgi:hypothetical protein
MIALLCALVSQIIETPAVIRAYVNMADQGVIIVIEDDTLKTDSTDSTDSTKIKKQRPDPKRKTRR